MIWLNLVSPDGPTSTALVVYVHANMPRIAINQLLQRCTYVAHTLGCVHSELMGSIKNSFCLDDVVSLAEFGGVAIRPQ